VKATKIRKRTGTVQQKPKFLVMVVRGEVVNEIGAAHKKLGRRKYWTSEEESGVVNGSNESKNLGEAAKLKES